MDTPGSVSLPDTALLYQPRFDCRSGEMVGAKLYVLRPQRNDNVVITAVSSACMATLREACRQTRAWNQTGGKRIVLTLGARLEALCEPAFAHGLNAVLLETRLEPHCLELSIITTQAEIPELTTTALLHLKSCGIRLSISAASPANATLAWIKQLPVDSLEVPAGLVHDVAADPEGVAIVRALISRAHKMKLSVSAKGIDNAHTASVLLANGCDLMQGPLFGNALPAEDFSTLVAADQRLDASLLRGPMPERTLLLVDDEENILSSLRRLLRREGYTILTANSGTAGLEVLAAHPVDVIVSDQRMPGMTGVEFLRKAKDMYPDSVRLVLSGYTDLQSVTDAINEGAIYKFLTKPWDDAMLRANIEEAFRRKALSDENQRLGSELQHANEELERINERLKGVLADQDRRLRMDEASLSLTQEALAVMPVPLLGVDPCGMIAFANRAAEGLFADLIPLIGLSADEVLPADFIALLAAGQGCAEISCDTRRFRVEAHPLGDKHSARGTLLSFTCRTDSP
jgi:EAL domain-containing protein (putative c-di-GMP-specific phosphodiesterase class I)/CheY-like chemotaxis protein